MASQCCVVISSAFHYTLLGFQQASEVLPWALKPRSWHHKQGHFKADLRRSLRGTEASFSAWRYVARAKPRNSRTAAIRQHALSTKWSPWAVRAQTQDKRLMVRTGAREREGEQSLGANRPGPDCACQKGQRRNFICREMDMEVGLETKKRHSSELG